MNQPTYNHLIEVTRYGQTRPVWIEGRTYDEYRKIVNDWIIEGFTVAKKAVMRAKKSSPIVGL